MTKKIQIFLFFALLSLGLSAQNTYNLTGTIQNSQGEKIEMATVRLFTYTETDSTLVQGAQTDMDGFFLLSNVRPGRYRLWFSSIGYYPLMMKAGIKDAHWDLGVITLKEDVHTLAEVDVKGHAAEMTVKGDTLEYNTSAYKMNDNAMVEDLLKKMSGVDVDKEGNVTVNGESIKAVRIDGKKFFGNDVQAATKNIPAEMIEKVQVIDEKSDMAKLTGFEDDETERIINLTLKANRKKGVFGNYKGGLGFDMITDNDRWFDYANPIYGATAAERTKSFFNNDFRYNANLFTNILLGESQTTIIGSANNTNEIRTGRGRGWFGGNNSGITQAENLGVNTNIDFNSKLKHKRDKETSLLFGANVNLTHSSNDMRSISNKDSYTNGGNYHNNDSTFKLTRSWDVDARFELEYQIDTFNKLIFEPRITYTNSNSKSYEEYLYRKDTALINDGYQRRNSQSEEIGANLAIRYNHLFLKPGRSFTMSVKVDFKNTKSNCQTYSFDNLRDSILVNQHTLSANNSINYWVKGSYVEPIHGRNHFLETAVTFSANTRFSHKDQYDLEEDGDSTYNEDYSNRLDNRFYTERLEENYRWVDQKFDLLVGIRAQASQTHTTTFYGNSTTPYRDTLVNVWNFAPNVSFKYKFGKKEFARVIYRGYFNQPSITQMEPVRNNSNAMNETVGNLSLNPEFRHFLRVMYSRYNQDRFSNLMTGVRANLTKDALVNNSIYDETGKLYQQTVNANALPFDVSADLMYNTPFANKMLQFHTRTAISYNQRVAYVSHEQTAEQISAAIASGNLMLGDRSLTGNMQVSEDLTLRFTHDVVDLGVRGNFRYSLTKNNLSSVSTSNVFNWSVTGDVEFHLPKQWNIAADCGYTARYGYQLSDVNEVLLNASISKSWGNATLEIKAYDLLHQKKNIVQVVGENYVQYQKFNTLPTYAMITFSYRLNKMGNLKASGMAGHMQDMIEGGFDPSKGPGQRMPMGPPPMLR